MPTKFSKYFTLIFILLILYLSIRILESFFSAILAAVILSYISYPIFSRINKYIKNKDLAIFIMVFLVFLAFVIPTILIINLLLKDLIRFYAILEASGFQFSIDLPDKFSFLDQYVADATQNIVVNLIQWLRPIVSSLPQRIVAGLIMFFSMFVFLKKGPEIIKKIKKILPMEDLQKDQLLNEFRNVTKGVVYSTIISMFLQGILGGLGFWFFGIPNPALWGLVMAILSLVPLVGVTPVYVGGLIHLFFSQSYIKLGLLVIYAIFGANVDQLITSKVIGDKASLNPILTLVGILGGIKVFGFVGIIVGPFVLSLLMAIIRFYTSNFKKEFSI